MSRSVRHLGGVGEKLSERLSLAGIRTISQLLQQGRSRRQRHALAARTSISEEKITRWVYMSDLIRVKGIATHYADLLELAGVRTVCDLARVEPVSLLSLLESVNEHRKVCKIIPTPRMIDDWIRQAQLLERMIVD